MSAHAVDENPLVIPPDVRDPRLRRWWVWAAGAVLASIALIVALLLFRNARPPPVHYRTAPVVRRTIESLVDAAGRLDVTTRVEVPAPAAGQLSEILVYDGASVSKGQVLAQLDEAAAGIAVGGARAAVHGAEQKIQEAQAALEAATDAGARLERLLPRGLASESEVVSARTSVTKARAALAAARAERSGSGSDLSAAELARKVRTLRAPMDGVVLAAPRWPGAVVGPERGPLFVIGSPLAELRLEVQVAEASVGQVRPAQSASFTVPAFPERDFAAEVEQVMLEAQREGGAVSYPVVLRAKNPGELMPGMSATARIRVARAENVLAVRDAALRFTPDQAPQAPSRSRLWVTPDGVRVESVSVASGLSDGMYTEVQPVGGATLQPGAQVVIGRVTSENGDNGPGISLGSKR